MSSITGSSHNDSFDTEYRVVYTSAEAMRQAVHDELSLILKKYDIPLAFSLESRVKSLSSLKAKAEVLELSSILEFYDLIGIRIILQFKRDTEAVKLLIEKFFDIKKKYDTSERLKENQFGYSSFHYVIKLKQEWLSIPRFADLSNMQAEVQVRTTAQHIWAAASHILQYKNEGSVPLELRRSIYRISALLETVDLEFDRLLNQRGLYRNALDVKIADGRILDVDVLEKVLDECLPNDNKDLEDDYAELLGEVLRKGIDTAGNLRSALIKYHDSYTSLEKHRVMSESEFGYPVEDADRLQRGVFFTYAGLVRHVLAQMSLDSVSQANSHN